MKSTGMSCATFSELLAPCLPSLRGLIFARLRGANQAEDVVQQTLMQAFLHRDSLRVPSKFKSWIRSIALNEIRMHHRRDRAFIPLHELAPVNCQDRGMSPLTRLEEAERSNWLASAMARLSERDRETIRLCDLHGLSVSEAAKALHISVPAARSTHFRARCRLEVLLRRTRAAIAA